MALEYLKFDIRLPKSPDAEHQAAIVDSVAGHSESTVVLPLHDAEFQHKLADLRNMLLGIATVRRATHLQETIARAVGQALFTTLFHDEILRLYEESLRKAASLSDIGLLLRFEIEEPTLAALPWELLYDPRGSGRYISCYSTTPIVRTLPPPYQAVPPPITTGPLRMLCMVANPADQVALNIEQEKRHLRTALQPLIDDGSIEIHWIDGQKWRDLQDALRSEAWHIFHFIGHGGFEEQTEGSIGTLAFADESDHTQSLTATQVAQLLGGITSLRLVVLNACEGARGNAQDIFSSTATTLLSQCHHLAAVLAMQYEITDDAALEFTRTFYKALAAKASVETAVTEARVAIGIEVRKTLEWGTPVLYTRSPHSVLFTFEHAERKAIGERLFTCRDHQTPIRTIAWSPDRQFLASGDDEGLVVVSDGQTGTTLSVYRYHTDVVQSVSWSHDSTRIASASTDGYIHVWNAITGQQQLQLTLHRIPSLDPRVITAAWSPDGRFIAAGSNSEQVKIWDSESGQLLMTYREHTHKDEILPRLGWILSLAWSPDSRYIVSGGGGYNLSGAGIVETPLFDKSVHIWEARTGRRAATYNAHAKSVTSLAWSPDGRYIASGDRNRQIHVWEPTNTANPLVFRGHTKIVNAVTWSPDSTCIASASDDTTVRIWQIDTHNERYMYKGHADKVNAVAWSPDGKRIASGGSDTMIHVWQAPITSTASTASTTSTPPTGNTHTRMLNRSNGTPPGQGTLLYVYDTHANWVSAVAWSPDGSRIASSGGDGTVRIWNPNNGDNLLTYHGQAGKLSEVLVVAWSPDSTRIASAGNKATIQVWNATNKQLLAHYDGHSTFANVPYFAHIFWAAWSPDGSRIASTSITLGRDKAVHIWNPTTGHQILKFDLHTSWIDTSSSGGVTWSPDGSRIAVGLNGETRVYNMTTGTQILSYTQQTGYISTVAWSPDGSRIASLEASSVHVWDAATGTFLYTYQGHTNAMRDVAWSPDGQYLASSSNDRTVQLWTASNGTRIYTYTGHNDEVGALSWAPDSHRIASASKDKTVHIWQAI